MTEYSKYIREIKHHSQNSQNSLKKKTDNIEETQKIKTKYKIQIHERLTKNIKKNYILT